MKEALRRRVQLGAFTVAALVIVVAAVGGALWLVARPEQVAGPENDAREAGSSPIDCSAPGYGNKITGTVEGDVEVTEHGTTCTIQGIVKGSVTVRDESPNCDGEEALTAVDVVGGTVEGDVQALGRRCVMVFLEDGARIEGDVIYGAGGNLGFLGNAAGGSVGGDVLLGNGHLWAHGASTSNRIDGDLVCQGGGPKEGLGSGSKSNWDGFENDIDGTIGGTYRAC